MCSVQTPRMQAGAHRRGQKCQNFPCCGKHVAQLPAHQLLPHLGRGGLNPSSSSSLPAPGSCTTRHPPGKVLWMPIFHLPLEMDSGSREVLQERLRNEGSGNRTAAGILPYSLPLLLPEVVLLGRRAKEPELGVLSQGKRWNKS